MKLACDGKELRAALDWLSGFSARKNTHPVLRSVFVEAGTGLTLRTCDGEKFGQTTVHALCEEPGSVCVDVAMLRASLTDGISVEAELDKGRFVVRECGFVSRLMFMPGDEFPAMPKTEAAMVPTDKGFWESVAAVEVASDDPIGGRPYLANVAMSDGCIVATNEHRMHVVKTEVPFDGVIAPGAARAALGMGTVECALDSGKTWLSSAGMSACLNSYSGQYPNWQRVVPQDFSRTFQADRGEVLEALKFLSGKCGKAERLNVSREGGTLKFLGKDDDRGETTAEVSVIGKNSDGHEFACNRSYLVEALTLLKSAGACFQMTEHSRPVTLSAEADDRDRFALVMPMSLG